MWAVKDVVAHVISLCYLTARACGSRTAGAEPCNHARAERV